MIKCASAPSEIEESESYAEDVDDLRWNKRTQQLIHTFNVSINAELVKLSTQNNLYSHKFLVFSLWSILEIMGVVQDMVDIPMVLDCRKAGIL